MQGILKHEQEEEVNSITIRATRTRYFEDIDNKKMRISGEITPHHIQFFCKQYNAHIGHIHRSRLGPPPPAAVGYSALEGLPGTLSPFEGDVCALLVDGSRPMDATWRSDDDGTGRGEPTVARLSVRSEH